MVILALELVPFTFTFALSSRGVVPKLYGFDAAYWFAWIAAAVITAAYVAYAARAFPIISENLFTLNAKTEP